MHSLSEAFAAIASRAIPLGTETVPLRAAFERCLGEHVTGRFPLPGFDNSAMDGYAVRFAELVAAPSAVWTVCGESRAGGPAPQPLSAGQVMRIFTGSPTPEGADTVVIQENAEVVAHDQPGSAAGVRFTSPPQSLGQHVRLAGSDLAAGALALNTGQIIRAGELALLASQGYSQVLVYRRPRVAILCTGDELCDVEEAGQPGKVVNSNAYALAALVKEAGGDPWVLEVASDKQQVVAQRVRQALVSSDSAVDILITVGGVSVGEYDVVWPALAEVGVERHFWKVAIKPGKPVLFGSLGDRLVFGLPGNPISAMVTFELFVRPALRMMQGDNKPYRLPMDARLATTRRHGHTRTEVLRARLRDDASMLIAEPVAHQGSGSLPSMVGVDALVFLPPGPESYDAGCSVRVWPLRPSTTSQTPAL